MDTEWGNEEHACADLILNFLALLDSDPELLVAFYGGGDTEVTITWPVVLEISAHLLDELSFVTGKDKSDLVRDLRAKLELAHPSI